MKLLETEQEEVKTGRRGKGWNAPMALRVWRSSWQGWDCDHQSSLSKWWDLKSPWKPLWVGLLGCFQEALTEAGRSTECGQHCSTGWGSRLNKKGEGSRAFLLPLLADCSVWTAAMSSPPWWGILSNHETNQASFLLQLSCQNSERSHWQKRKHIVQFDIRVFLQNLAS